jgi:hypothetical protein
LGQRRAKSSGHMMPTFTPVQTLPRKVPPFAAQMIEVNAKVTKPRGPGTRDNKIPSVLLYEAAG